MRNILIVVVLVLLGGGVWYFISAPKAEAPVPVLQPSSNVSESSAPSAPADSLSGGQDKTASQGSGVSTPPSPSSPGTDVVLIPNLSRPASSVKEFTVVGSNYSFTPNTMTVQKGDTVKITFKNQEGFHDLKLDEFKAATQKIGGGKQETITFVADRVGSFEYYCSVGNHRANGMRGTIAVTQ